MTDGCSIFDPQELQQARHSYIGVEVASGRAATFGPINLCDTFVGSVSENLEAAFDVSVQALSRS
jgi:hypothetical protein